MIKLRHAAWLSVLALLAATPGLADSAAGPNPPQLTSEEQALIKADARLVEAAATCPRQLRQALDAWAAIRRGAPPAAEPEPCQLAPPGPGRASDEGALDILKILKEAAGQGTSR